MANSQRQPLLSRPRVDDIEEYRQADYGTQHVTASATDSHLLDNTLYPPDAYKGKHYWADLDGRERRSFAHQQYNLETKNEFNQVRQMFRTNPFNPLKAYIRNYVAAGAGFFAEGNVLFSVGNTMPLLKALAPECWRDHLVCDVQMIRAIKYMEILGVSTIQGLKLC